MFWGRPDRRPGRRRTSPAASSGGSGGRGRPGRRLVLYSVQSPPMSGGFVVVHEVRPSLCPRVSAFMHQEQPLLRHMSVDLRGLQAGVPEQFLDHSQIGTIVQQMSGEAVTERVGVQGLGRRWSTIRLASRGERRRPRRLRNSAAAGRGGHARAGRPVSIQRRDRRGRGRAQGDLALLGALAPDRHQCGARGRRRRRRGRRAPPPAGRCRRAVRGRRRLGSGSPRGRSPTRAGGASNRRRASSAVRTRGRRTPPAGALSRSAGLSGTGRCGGTTGSTGGGRSPCG